MIMLPWILLLVSWGLVLYHRGSVAAWAGLASLSVLLAWIAHAPDHSIVWAGATALVATLGWCIAPLRRRWLSSPLLKAYRKVLPPLSETERVALAAGTVGFEGEIFSGKPRWEKLLGQPAPRLSMEELAFLSGPVEDICALADDWRINNEWKDLPEEVWALLKRHKFFGMIIPKEHGGLGFSAYAHHCVIQKLASRSVALASTVGVPNSLGPAELILHYGTAEQKAHYLPRLAEGKDIPCFALTGPFAGSDATSIPDYGVVCKGMWEGREVLGVRLNFDKRYITLAPVATLVGVAFRMCDPDGLLGRGKDIGISLALVPRSTAGMTIGRRHIPLDTPFQNGPIQGKDVFVPLTQLIGGEEYAGQGWRMLVECLSIGRSITLPSCSAGGARLASVASGTYARIRKQFGTSIGRFEGVQEALARMAGHTYAISALARATAAAVDRGERPAVPSAIAKYHCTELGRKVIQDAMDVHGGKGIILGPRNYLGRAWQSAPIGITVEGANIMTRSLMIFGQGAVLCHPWVMKEMQAAQDKEGRGLVPFDHALSGHVEFSLSNAVRAFWMGLTGARFSRVPGSKPVKKFIRQLDRQSAILALVTDVAMLSFGGGLKFREAISGRMADALSQIYIGSAMLKKFQDDGFPGTDEPVLEWNFSHSKALFEQSISQVLANLPSRALALFIRGLVFPLGMGKAQVPDRLMGQVALGLMVPGDARSRLAEGLYLTPSPDNAVGRLFGYLDEVVALETLEGKFHKLVKGGGVEGLSFDEQLSEGVKEGWITPEQRQDLEKLRTITLDVISVDDFADGFGNSQGL